MKKRLLILPLLLGMLASCSITSSNDKNIEEEQREDEKDEKVSVKSILLDSGDLSLIEGESITLTYTIFPKNATNKKVTWESSDSIVASVENGTVKAWNPGITNISVTTEDGSKKDTCRLVVNKAESEEKIVKKTFKLSEQSYTSEINLIENPITFEDYTISFAQGTNTYPNNYPKIIKATNNHYEARVNWGNTFTVTSAVNTLCKIEFTLGANDDGNTLTCSTGEMINGTWIGESKEITFSVHGSAGKRAFEAFTLCYEGETEDDPDVVINLGNKTIAEVKEYIAEHPVKKNAFGNGVNENRYVTIKGYALAKIDLQKSTASFGLDVSEHGKIIMADETGSIGVASQVNNQGTSLWGKIADYVCKDTSKYIVTGYLSEYLGHPELMVTSFTWDQSLIINLDYSKISSGVISLEEFYTKAQNTNYNCAGHAYGDVVTINNLKCYYCEPDGQGKRYYNFTDGTRNIRVNAFNLSSVTVGNVYNVTGVISLKNLSPIIVAFNFTSSQETVDFNYENAANSLTISQLKAIHGSQDDTSEKFPELINVYSGFYKTTGYMVAVEENGKLYVGISDTPRKTVITGKTNAMANYNVVLIKNENFWNTTEDELYLFNPIYEDYLCEENEIEIYYIPRQLNYSNNKPLWEILLIPESISII